MAESRRRGDHGWRLLIRENWYRDVWMLGLTILLLLSLNALSSEGRARRDQTCTVFERQFQSDIRQLKGTYDYLLKLSPGEASSPLNSAVLEQLPQAESRVRTDHPPAYCAEPGVGLDDRTFLPVPKRPLDLPLR